jgi:hypothetical protein
MVSLSSFNFGSTSTINIPIGEFVGSVVLHLRIPVLQANEAVCPGWGYRMINNIAYSLGASNTTQIVLQGDSILQALLAQCPNAEKRSEVLKMGGQGAFGPTVALPGEDIETLDAYCLLPIPPFSDLCGHLPIDTTLLSNNISISISMESNPKLIYGGSATHPASFLVAELLMRQGKLSDQSASIRTEMVRNANLKYSIPMIHYQHWESSSFPGKRRSDGKCSVELNTFPNADLCGIVCWVIRDDYKNPTGNNCPNPYITDEISDIVLTLGGATLFNLPSKSYKMTNMLTGGHQDASFFNNQLITGTAAPFSAVGKDCYPLCFDFSREKSACLPGQLFNVARYPSQQMRLEFCTSQGSSVNYRVFCTYIANAVAELENGTSSVHID